MVEGLSEGVSDYIDQRNYMENAEFFYYPSRLRWNTLCAV